MEARTLTHQCLLGLFLESTNALPEQNRQKVHSFKREMKWLLLDIACIRKFHCIMFRYLMHVIKTNDLILISFLSSATTVLVLTMGSGVDGFTLDPGTCHLFPCHLFLKYIFNLTDRWTLAYIHCVQISLFSSIRTLISGSHLADQFTPSTKQTFTIFPHLLRDTWMLWRRVPAPLELGKLDWKWNSHDSSLFRDGLI